MKGDRGMRNLKISTKLNGIVVIFLVVILGFGVLALTNLKDIANTATETLEKQTRQDYDDAIKEQVDNAISMLNVYYSAYEEGTLTLDEAKKQGADMLRAITLRGTMAIFGQMIPREIISYCLAMRPKEPTVWIWKMQMAMR